MKKLFGILIVLSAMSLASCTSVSTGHKGVKIKWGGKADMSQLIQQA